MKFRREDGPIEMWIREEMIPSLKSIISGGRFQEWYMWYGDPNHTEEERKKMRSMWVSEKAPLITLEDVLYFGNKVCHNNWK